jgi:MYXO-CTERM domain-containing protein
LLVACAKTQDAGEHIAARSQPFSSGQAVPLDFEVDGRLVADTDSPGTLRTLIEAQFLFTIGQLNGDASVGRLGLLEVSKIRATQIAVPPPPAPPVVPGLPPPPPPPLPPPIYEVRYHAKLPVAWGGPTKPSSYTFTLPARVHKSDQVSFAAKYGRSCVDPDVGHADAGHMFAAYRPQRSDCNFSSEDVVRFTADVKASPELTSGKYPEYHRVWKDDALDVVAVFTREDDDPVADDGGVIAYDNFVWRMHDYLELVQPDAAKRREPMLPASPAAAGMTTLTLAADLPDGRSMKIDARLVGTQLDKESAAFDLWYDGLTPSADVIVFNGHAGLGSNVRSLMEKGSFRTGQYVVWFANGCDTLAYVDDRLSSRRDGLNPDDPNGTKYMDMVTNVLAGYFSDLEDTAVTFIRAFVEVRYPEIGAKTYEQIFGGIDPSQVAVVTGEEDNVLEPLPPGKFPPGPPPGQPAAAQGAEVTAADEAPVEVTESRTSSGGDEGCSVGRSGGAGSWLTLLVGAALALTRRRRRVA